VDVGDMMNMINDIMIKGEEERQKKEKAKFDTALQK